MRNTIRMRFLFLILLTAGAAMAAEEVDRYFFGFLRMAPNRATLPREEMTELQKQHLAHLNAMAEKGALVAAGPLRNGGERRGVIIYQTETLAAAIAMANADPMVKRGQMVVELEPWVGPKGIGEEYKRVQRESGGKMQDKMIQLWITHTQAEGWKIHRAKPETVAEGATIYEWFCADGTLPPPVK